MTPFYEVDSVTGAGKTYACMNYAGDKLATKHKFAIFQPTKRLINASHDGLLERRPELVDFTLLVTSDSTTNVSGEITDLTKTVKQNRGELIFGTHAAFERMQYWHNRQNWHIIIDEPMNITWHRSFRLAKHRDLIKNKIDMVAEDGEYTRIMATDFKALESMLRYSDRDEIVKNFQDFYSKLMTAHWRLYVDTKRYKAFLSGKEDGFDVFGMIGPEIFDGFASVTFAAANLKRSFMYRYFTKLGITFNRHQAINNKLRYDQHTNGNRVEIRYLTDRLWSKHLRDTGIKIGHRQSTVGELYRDEINKTFNGQKCLVIKNQDVEDGFGFDNARFLPSDPRGLNDFMDFDNIAVYSALNPLPAHGKLLQYICGITVRDLHQTILSETAYQAIGRSSLRDPNAVTPVIICVPDRTTADDIAALYPGCSIQQMAESAHVPSAKKAGRHGSPNGGISSVERANYQVIKEKRNKIQIFEIQSVDTIIHEVDEDSSVKNPCNETPYYERILYYDSGKNMTELAVAKTTDGEAAQDLDAVTKRTKPGFAISMFRSFPQKDGSLRWDSKPYLTNMLMPTTEMVAFLKECQTRKIAKKADNQCLSPSLYDPDADDTTDRGLANVFLARGVWLDFDGGDVTPEIAAHVLQGLELIIYSSFSSTPEKPRFRIGIPTTGVMNVPVYRNIMAQLIKLFNDHSYWTPKEAKTKKYGKLHGIDMSKLQCASLFYLPCHTEHCFFQHIHEQRLPIMPISWIRNSTVSVDEYDPTFYDVISDASEGVPAVLNDDPGRVGRVIARWQQEGGIAGVGHAKFFALACGLARAGVDQFEMNRILFEQAMYAHNPAERRREIAALLQDRTVTGSRRV